MLAHARECKALAEARELAGRLTNDEAQSSSHQEEAKPPQTNKGSKPTGGKIVVREKKGQARMIGLVLAVVLIWFVDPMFDKTGWEGDGMPSSPRKASDRLKSTRTKKMEFGSAPDLNFGSTTQVVKGLETHEEGRTRDLKKGPGAWVNFRNEGEQVCADRLVIHSVADETGRRAYLPAVDKLFDYIQEHKLPCASWDDLDVAIVTYFTTACYGEDRHPQMGANALNGFCYLYPAASRHLPAAWRSLQSWTKLHVQLEGAPVAEETIAVMQRWLQEHKDPRANEAADMMGLAVDGYLREQDMEQMTGLDVIETTLKDGSKAVVLHFGRGSRGERSKTGRDQGVVVDWPHNAAVMMARKEKLTKPEEKIFKISKGAYRVWWNKAADAVGGGAKHVGPPHSARHTGAARDMAEGYRSFDQVQRRGRWRPQDSVLRYGRTHAWHEARARQSKAVQSEGGDILAKREPRPSIARE
jgi:hypothetical protein